MIIKPSFSINEYDSDGDLSREGIYLHFGDNCRIRVADTKEDLEDLLKHMEEVVVEINKHW